MGHNSFYILKTIAIIRTPLLENKAYMDKSIIRYFKSGISLNNKRNCLKCKQARSVLNGYSPNRKLKLFGQLNHEFIAGSRYVILNSFLIVFFASIPTVKINTFLLVLKMPDSAHTNYICN